MLINQTKMLPIKYSKSSKEILSTSAQLNSLVDKTLYLKKLEQSLTALLPPLLTPHCSVANVRQDQLILHVDAASWGMQLRYLTKDLLNQLRQEKSFAQISAIKYKIRPRQQPQPTITTPPSLSTENKNVLAELKQLLAKRI